MKEIRNKIFSLQEANALIPFLESALDRLANLGQEATVLRREIELLSAIASAGASEANPDVVALREAERCQKILLDQFRSELRAVTRHGCIVRDLEAGLVDFYTVARNQVICLCWRRGEPRVEHWHPTDEGFAGRRPLTDLA